MAVKLNNIIIQPGFRGLLQLGRIDRLFVSGDAQNASSLHGTLFKQEKQKTVSPPSDQKSYKAGEDLRLSITAQIHRRTELVRDVTQLEELRGAVKAAEYSYGVSNKLVKTLKFLTENTIKPLPSTVVGGCLAYEDLIKTTHSTEALRSDWVNWSHTDSGLKRYQGE